MRGEDPEALEAEALLMEPLSAAEADALAERLHAAFEAAVARDAAAKAQAGVGSPG